MNFQTRCNRYLQKIRRTQESTAATPELSLFPHLQALLEELSVDHFRRDTIRFVQEPRRLDQIGRPDFVAMDGLLPIGYIEAEAIRQRPEQPHGTRSSTERTFYRKP